MRHVGFAEFACRKKKIKKFSAEGNALVLVNENDRSNVSCESSNL